MSRHASVDLRAFFLFREEHSRERPLAPGLVEDVRAANLFLGFTHAGKLGGKLKRLSGKALEKELATWLGMYALHQGPTEEPGATRLSLSYSGVEMLHADLTVSGPDLEARRETILDEMIDLVVRWQVRVRGRGWVAHAKIWPGEAPYPRMRPPPSHRYWGFGYLVEAYCLEAHENNMLGHPDDVRRILAAEVPEVATREEREGLTIFRWARDATDPLAMMAARANHARWLARIVVNDADKIASWNEAGDEGVQVNERLSHSPLTFYDSLARVGYKALVVQPGGVVDETFDRAAAWARARQLPDGTPLSAVRFIVPIRENVFEIADRARAAGIDMVLYMDEQYRLWNPLPAGMWLPAEPADAKKQSSR